METFEQDALEAQINALDQDTARRVARLVVECHASVPLALRAVQEANDSMQARTHTERRPHARDRFAHILTCLGVLV
jgi:hypothetical protein